MSFMRFIICFLLFIVCLNPLFADNKANIPILCYHNLNPTVPGSMSMTPAKFESQIKWIKDNGFTIVPLKEVVEYLKNERGSLPEKAVAITVDDGWESVYRYMAPIIKKYNIPVTLFIYPETISNGVHAMTWVQLKELQKNPLFDIQSHTYSHPNFKQEKRHLSLASYEKFVEKELVNSKKILEQELGTKMTLLAWPFGIYDKYLEKKAAEAGYVMAFSIDARDANDNYPPMSEPRFMIVDGLSAKSFQAIVKSAR
ncbi:MAG TPA: polysaccharide deacetylase family protein [Gammaproteobacteria bacterium]|nr:polysaccharide deacetylase family protein [Gammaproteobacteria bacterium]